jgi:hypothetical protein
MTPFILLARKMVPAECPSSATESYDHHKQIWIDTETGEPLVCRMRNATQPSQFGETTFTETREGADQSEASVFSASQFGETTFTKTSEGVDATEIVGLLSPTHAVVPAPTILQGIDVPSEPRLKRMQWHEKTSAQ